MNKEEALKYIDQLLAPKCLTERDRIILGGSWDGKEYAQIAPDLNCGEGHAKVLGKKLWQLLSEAVDRPVTKSLFRPIFEQMLQPIPVLGDSPPINLQFFGRAAELAQLSTLIDENRLVAIVGSPGIGKSALIAKLLQLSNPVRWEKAVWKTLNPTTQLDSLVESLLSDLEVVRPTARPQDPISLLLRALDKQRCLIVLDAAEVVRDHPEYEMFLRQVVNATNRSCVLLTSEDMINFVEYWQLSGLSAKLLLLRSLDEDAAKQILRSFNLQDEEYWSQLIQTHGANPLVLKLVANSIVDLFDGRVADTIYITALYTEELSSLITRQFRKLGTNNQRVVLALAQSDEPSFAELLKQPALDGLSQSDLFQALSYLEKRSIIEVLKKKNESSAYKLSSLIKKYALSTLASGLNKSTSYAIGA